MTALSNICDLSIVIPYHNRIDDLHSILSALSEQVITKDFIVEVLVVDNASTIPPDPLVHVFPWVHWLSEPSPGPAKARNTGVAAARGTWLAFLDGDIVPNHDWVATGFHHCLQSTNPLMIVAGKIEPRFVYSTFTERVDAESLNQEYFVNHLQRAATGNLWMSKHLFERCNGFKEELILYEDFELVKRALTLGATLDYLPTCIGRHRVRATLRALITRSKRQARAFIVSMRHCGIENRAKIFGATAISRIGKISKVFLGTHDMLPSSVLVRLARCVLLIHETLAVGFYLVFSPKSTRADIALMQRSQD